MVLRILNVSFHDGPNSPVPPQLVREMKVVLISLIQFLPLSSCLLELWRSLSVKMSIDPKCTYSLIAAWDKTPRSSLW